MMSNRTVASFLEFSTGDRKYVFRENITKAVNLPKDC
jgi:hypothetical protein